MSDTGFTAGQREKMVCIMDLNGYEQDGKGPRFISLDSGEVLEFQNWAQVFEFIKAHFASRVNTAGNWGRKKSVNTPLRNQRKICYHMVVVMKWEWFPSKPQGKKGRSKWSRSTK